MTYNGDMKNIYEYCCIELCASKDEAEFFTIIYGNTIEGDINDERTHFKIKYRFVFNRDKLNESIEESRRYNEESRLRVKVKTIKLVE